MRKLVINQYIARNRILKKNNTTYEEYLRSDLWKHIRSIHLSKELNKQCYVCGSDKYIQVHHKGYTKIFDTRINVQLSKLVTLCGECHLKVHELCETKGYGLGQSVRKLRKSFIS